MSFSEILDAVDYLEFDDQVELSRILHQRIIEKKRDILFNEISESEKEFNSGTLEPQSVNEIIEDLLK